MPPKAPPISTADLSWAVAKKILNQSDIERLACAMLNTEDIYKFDTKAAAEQFGGVKPDSFKRQIWVIAKRIKEASEGNVTETVGTEKASGGKGRKRKTPSEDVDDSATKSKAKGAKKSKQDAKGTDRKADGSEDDAADSVKLMRKPLEDAADSTDLFDAADAFGF